MQSAHRVSRCFHASRSLPAAAPQRLVQRSSQQRRSRRLVVSNMFTGIVQGMASVAELDSKENFKSFRIKFPAGKTAGVQIGASVAINGTCLTVTAIDGDVLTFDVMMETLRVTSLGGLQVGSPVNFERSARVGDEIGGHNVSGHVHCTARIDNVEDSDNNRRVTFKLPDSRWMKYILPKGFIAVDGCSLTVGEVAGDTFSVYLIPETLRVTVFGTKAAGDPVNIEIEAQTQAIVETVERVVQQYLQQAGIATTPANGAAPAAAAAVGAAAAAATQRGSSSSS